MPTVTIGIATETDLAQALIAYKAASAPISRVPVPTFQIQTPSQVANGSLCTGSLVSTISDNQMWLHSQDVPFINFYTKPSHSDGGGVVGELPGIQGTPDYAFMTKFRIPPFVEYMEIWFWLASAFDEVVGTPPQVIVTCDETGDIVYLTLIEAGSNVAGKGTTLRENEAAWVGLTGVPDESLTEPTELSGRALMVSEGYNGETRLNEWQEITITVTVPDSVVQIFTAACRAIPSRGPFTYPP